MTGNQNPYDPAEMFKEWIQKSGKAQAEFMKNFGALMPIQKNEKFDPAEVLNAIANQASNAQANFMDNLSSMQNKGMDQMFNLSQFMPNFLSWGAYKTSIGSNGRISIPEAERDALGLKEGDLVQVIVLPIAKKSKNKEVKQ